MKTPILHRALVVLLLALATGCGASGPATKGRAGGIDEAGDHRPWIALGDALMKEGDASRAAQYYEAAYRSGTKAVLPKLLAACVASGQYALAIEHAEAALARDPSDGHLRLLLAALDAETGQLVAAREHFETAATERPADDEVQFAVGVFFRDDAHEPGRADPYFRAYLRIAPAGAHAREARSSLLTKVD